MIDLRAPCLVSLAVSLAGCPSPVPGDTDTNATTGTSTTTGSTGSSDPSSPDTTTSDTPTTSPSLTDSSTTDGLTATTSTTSTTDTTSTTETTSTTTDATSTTTDTTSTSSTSTETTGDDSTGDTSGTQTGTTGGGGPPSTCGPPCAETWEHFGPLTLKGALEDFSCLTRVHGYLWVHDDVDLATFASLANLTHVDGSLHVFSEPTIDDLAPLGCVREVGALYLANLPQVSDLSPLANLRVAPEVRLEQLPITALPTFAPDFAGIELLDLMLMTDLADLSPAAAWGLGDGSFTFSMYGNTGLTDLTSLGGLVAANAAKGNDLRVAIYANDTLTSLKGLEAMKSGSLYLEGISQLADLAPLKQLATGDDVHLDNLDNLQSLAGLDGLTTVDSLKIGLCSGSGMDGLTNLAGLDNLTSVSELHLLNNDALASLSGAPLLTSVDSFDAIANPALSQAAHDAFVAQLELEPTGCFGDHDTCECIEIIPP